MVPCDIWRSTRDHKFTDEEFDANIRERIGNLDKQNMITLSNISQTYKVAKGKPGLKAAIKSIAKRDLPLFIW